MHRARWAEAGASIPLIRDGKLRALAVSSTTRLPLLPDVPPLAETAPGFEAVSWHMLLAPAKTPRDIVDRLHAEMKRALAQFQLMAQNVMVATVQGDIYYVRNGRVPVRARSVSSRRRMKVPPSRRA